MPVRKDIRLQKYDYSQPGCYFVTICTHNRQPLFVSFVGAHLCVRPPVDDSFLVKWLYELEKKYPGVEIDSCAIMPDHIHVIITITGAHIGAPLQEMIKWYKTQTTNAYIRQVREGILPPYEKHIWQRGYYDHIIRNDDDLDQIRQYIQNNPLKRNLEQGGWAAEGGGPYDPNG
jgi:REP element-mobilizing transposase RayT